MGLLSFLFGGKAPELTPEEIASIDIDTSTHNLSTGFSMHSAGDVFPGQTIPVQSMADQGADRVLH